MIGKLSLEENGIERVYPSVIAQMMMPMTMRDTILVVDDNPTNLSVLCEVLSTQNYQISVAQNGEDALACANEILPDLILLDVMMPGIDGFETCKRLKASPKTHHIPILFMTALSETVDKVRGLSVGAVDYITKPFIQEETLARIKVHLSLVKARTRLIQSEKMSALGQLVAGIAHEINNPVSFIHGNLEPARHYAASLLSFVEVCQAQSELPDVVNKYADDLELEFVQQDFGLLLDSMKIGTERIRSVVESLRTFSCLDESEYKAVDIHKGLDSELEMLQHRLKPQQERARVTVIKSYDALPLLSCYPSKLNDVFLILMTNAIDALDAKFMRSPSSVSNGLGMSSVSELPVLTIETSLQSNQIIIQIVDNGVGICKEIRSQVFDQFFTTKPIGQNSGLGLAIASAIVMKEHKGTLTFHSEVGRGTVFKVALPIP